MVAEDVTITIEVDPVVEDQVAKEVLVAEVLEDLVQDVKVLVVVDSLQNAKVVSEVKDLAVHQKVDLEEEVLHQEEKVLLTERLEVKVQKERQDVQKVLVIQIDQKEQEKAKLFS